jgi:release factor glutamine methyltransferase
LLVAKALEQATKILTEAEVQSPRVDAELLACFVLGMTKSELQLAILEEKEFSTDQLENFLEAVSKRQTRIPLQHITKVAPFRHIELEVGPGVFTPRPETEQVVQFAIEKISQVPKPTVVDFCSGSGAIAISVATEVEGSEVYAVEKSTEAFGFLSRNFEKYGLADRNLRNQELVDSLDELGGLVDLVIANPPYIPNWAVPVDVEVQLHEPRLALYGGPDGLDVIRQISSKALQLLKPRGLLVLEHADTQAVAIRELLLDSGWINIESAPDLTGKDRMIAATKP